MKRTPYRFTVVPEVTKWLYSLHNPRVPSQLLEAKLSVWTDTAAMTTGAFYRVSINVLAWVATSFGMDSWSESCSWNPPTEFPELGMSEQQLGSSVPAFPS